LSVHLRTGPKGLDEVDNYEQWGSQHGGPTDWRGSSNLGSPVQSVKDIHLDDSANGIGSLSKVMNESVGIGHQIKDILRKRRR
jgi:hypothetical protein